MEEIKKDQPTSIEVTNSNIIFGTSSDDIQQGLANNQFIDSTERPVGDEDQIVNAQEQNEIVNPTEETFNEDTAQQNSPVDNTIFKEGQNKINQFEENINALNPGESATGDTVKISKAED